MKVNIGYLDIKKLMLLLQYNHYKKFLRNLSTIRIEKTEGQHDQSLLEPPLDPQLDLILRVIL